MREGDVTVNGNHTSSQNDDLCKLTSSDMQC